MKFYRVFLSQFMPVCNPRRKILNALSTHSCNYAFAYLSFDTVVLEKLEHLITEIFRLNKIEFNIFLVYLIKKFPD